MYAVDKGTWPSLVSLSRRVAASPLRLGKYDLNIAMVSPRINVDNMEVKVDRRPCTELPLSLSGVSGSSPFIVPYFLTRDLPNKIDDGLYLGSLKSATDR